VQFSLGNIQEALNQVYNPVIFTSVLIIIVNIVLAFLLSKTVIGPISVLNEATKDIAAGNLDLRIRINTRDELEELSETFNEMTSALKRMKAIAENANPLTHLPGNNVIQEEAENRMKANSKFVVIHTDLDNFKAYNDKYGLMKGDDAIRLCSDVLQESIKEKGNPNDFVGHEGGDDFVLITTPDKDKGVTDYVIKEFDKRIRELYSKEDLNRGHIISKGRDGKIKEFPLMSISLSGVTNSQKPINSYAEITNIVAEVKKKSKAIEKSCYVLDKRTEKRS
jgi:diguanylate cyclase (GGDEF)-like protein